jgi:hypothetical protein
MKRLILRLLVALLTFVFSLAVTWLTAYFSDEPSPNEAKAIRHIQEICTAQLVCSVTKGKGNFADLEALGREGLIDQELASGEKDGYIFTSKPLPKSANSPSMYDISAIPKFTALGIHSFYSNETCVIYDQKGIEPPTTTAYDRVPKNGIPLQ